MQEVFYNIQQSEILHHDVKYSIKWRHTISPVKHLNMYTSVVQKIALPFKNSLNKKTLIFISQELDLCRKIDVRSTIGFKLVYQQSMFLSYRLYQSLK